FLFKKHPKFHYAKLPILPRFCAKTIISRSFPPTLRVAQLRPYPHSHTSESVVADVLANLRNMPRSILPGKPYPQGATWDGTGVNFSLYSEKATGVELCLFDDVDSTECEVIALRECTGY